MNHQTIRNEESGHLNRSTTPFGHGCNCAVVSAFSICRATFQCFTKRARVHLAVLLPQRGMIGVSTHSHPRKPKRGARMIDKLSVFVTLK